jgi:hypothetical protein
MSPTSYQAAPPRLMTIAEVYCRVKFADQTSNPDKDFRPIPILVVTQLANPSMKKKLRSPLTHT